MSAESQEESQASVEARRADLLDHASKALAEAEAAKPPTDTSGLPEGMEEIIDAVNDHVDSVNGHIDAVNENIASIEKRLAKFLADHRAAESEMKPGQLAPRVAPRVAPEEKVEAEPLPEQTEWTRHLMHDFHPGVDFDFEVPPDISSLNLALKRATAKAAEEKMPVNSRLFLRLSARTYEALEIAAKTTHADDFVGIEVFDRFRDVFIVGRGLVSTTINAVRVGSRDPRGKVPKGCSLSFEDVRFESDGRRTMIGVNTGNDFMLSFSDCAFIAEDKEGLSSWGATWGMQLYNCALRAESCTVRMPDAKEHWAYLHGHGNRPSYVRSCRMLAIGGQFIQLTGREYEARYVRPVGFRIEDNLFANAALDAGRAGAAVTITGFCENVEVTRNVFCDFDPGDTERQPENKANTNYAALTMWTPPGDEQQAWEEKFDHGRGNNSLLVTDNVFLYRRPNRTVVNLRDCGSLVYNRNTVMVSEAPESRGVAINSPQYDQRSIGSMKVEGVGASDNMMAFARRAVKALDSGTESWTLCRPRIYTGEDRKSVVSVDPDGAFAVMP